MPETEQERNVLLAALREEIAGSEYQIAYLTDEIARLGDDRDYAAQVLMLQKDLEQHKRVLVAAQAEIDVRTTPVKRGPGRPRKNPAA
jgi:hypothetical protein